jgi:hypothetical protein
VTNLSIGQKVWLHSARKSDNTKSALWNMQKWNEKSYEMKSSVESYNSRPASDPSANVTHLNTLHWGQMRTPTCSWQTNQQEHIPLAYWRFSYLCALEECTLPNLPVLRAVLRAQTTLLNRVVFDLAETRTYSSTSRTASVESVGPHLHICFLAIAKITE